SSVGGGSLSSGESAGGGNLFDPGKFLPGGLPTDLGALIETIFRWVLWAATLVFLYQAFRAAWDLITKKEAETALRDAKKRLWNALIGFMILLFAQSIPGIIRDILTG
ncbi:MAG TPA: hypothetical protein PLN18_01040, partial [Candidatus Colwellbacteria bacterium]|nr:hypothetical protein [Candidatus Colwellbacteria bacterium]